MKPMSIATVFFAALFAATGLCAQPTAPAHSASSSVDADKRARPDGPALDADYRLGAGDKLRIEVYKDPQLSQSVQIRPDGKITLPLLGDVEATDRTPLELRDALTNALKEYITNPVVTVIVVEAIASRVFVMGEVTKAGPVDIHGPTTVLQALSMAGGFREFANTKHIRLLRQTKSGVKTIEFNYNDAVKGEDKPVYVRAGDTIVVP